MSRFRAALSAAAAGGPALVLDGGLATELERRGVDIGGPLWSARALDENPDAILELHLDSMRAGADIVISASYQASLQGLREAGRGPEESRALLTRAVELAVEARRRFREGPPPFAGAVPGGPFVAASVGPYGAYRHDGSEYRGDYGLDVSALQAFHAERLDILAGSGADLLACETIPCLAEAEALAGLLRGRPGPPAWISLSCADGARLRSGEPVTEAVSRMEDAVAAIGVNCTAPEHVTDLLGAIRSVSRKPLVVYPNSGEGWDAASGTWAGEASPGSLADRVPDWRAAGASVIGGCCRIGPEAIRAAARRLRAGPVA